MCVSASGITCNRAEMYNLTNRVQFDLIELEPGQDHQPAQYRRNMVAMLKYGF
jgi:hypothetical protein